MVMESGPTQDATILKEVTRDMVEKADLVVRRDLNKILEEEIRLA